MSRRIFRIGAMHQECKVMVGWAPDQQQFIAEITAAHGEPSVVSGTLHAIKAQLKAQGIEAPHGFMSALLRDAQANV